MNLADSRKVFGQALAELGEKNPKVVSLTADVGLAMKSDLFEKRFPNRYFNVGVQEAGMVDVAVGLALGGLIPYACTFATLFLRAVDQLRSCVAYPRTNVKIIAGYGGLSDFKDGATHQAVEDLAVMRSMPNMTVISPADPVEMKKLLPVIADFDGPVYLRISKAEVPVVFDDTHQVEVGKSVVLRTGKDLTLIANSIMVFRSLEAAKVLAEKGVDCRVINIHTIKPLDLDIVRQAADETGALVCAEEHSVIGGLGGAIAEFLSTSCPAILELVGVQDTFTQSSVEYEALLDAYELSVDDIVQAGLRALKRKETAGGKSRGRIGVALNGSRDE